MMRLFTENRIRRIFTCALMAWLIPAIAVHAETSKEWFGKAMALDKDGFYEEAAEAWEKTLAANPEQKIRSIALLKLSSTYFKLLQMKKSEETAKELAVSEPDNFDAHFHLANILAAQQLFPGAIEAFQKTVQIKPNEGLGYVGLALSFFGNRELEKAVEQVKKAKTIFKKKKNLAWYQNMRIMSPQIKNFSRYPVSFSNLWLENNLKMVRETYEKTLFNPEIAG